MKRNDHSVWYAERKKIEDKQRPATTIAEMSALKEKICHHWCYISTLVLLHYAL